MSLKRICKATGLTLAIIGLSSVHSFAIGERAIAENTAADTISKSLTSQNENDVLESMLRNVTQNL